MLVEMVCVGRANYIVCVTMVATKAGMHFDSRSRVGPEGWLFVKRIAGWMFFFANGHALS